MKYITKATIEASRMSRGDYNKLRGWTVPADEDPADEGYLMEFESGYISWMERKAFELAYKRFDTFEDRLAYEVSELSHKMLNLSIALRSDGFEEKVGSFQYALMEHQEEIMDQYLGILDSRIKHLKS